MTTMMTTAATRAKTTGGTAKMPDGVGEEFEAPLKRDKAKFGPFLGGQGVPLIGIEIGWGWGELER